MNKQLYATTAIKELEKRVIEGGTTEIELMQRAGHAAFKILQQHWPAARKIAVFCGKGNNGGDGYVVARLAHHAGYQVSVLAMAPHDELTGAALHMAEECQKAGVPMHIFPAQLPGNAEVIVDALLGTGFRGEITGLYREAIVTINALHLPVLALDVPSGLDANTGAVAHLTVQANVTITFAALKPGLFTAAGPAYAGEIHFDNLQVSPEFFQGIKATANLIEREEINAALPPRRRDAHKGDFGHVLIIGGDVGMAGAVRMAGEAAARVGAGLITIATHPENVAAIVCARPELMCYGIHATADLAPLLAKATVLVIGPGLGQSEWSRTLFEAALQSDLPKIIDADGLNLLAQQPQQQQHWILTPHPGEAARLLQTNNTAIQQDRFHAVHALQNKYSGVVVLKGVGTLVQGFREIPGICAAGNPGMASGGMGDVLSGVIGGLLAQRLELEAAARVGVLIHSLAADRAILEGGERGLLALDLLPYLHRLANPY